MPSLRPKVYRAMKKDADDKPTVDQTATGLGVRIGTDITTDAAGNVVRDDNGMSVAPGWRDLELHRIPKRLGTLVPGARGSNNTHCFTTGAGPFQRDPFAQGLELIPDTAIHAAVAPVAAVSLAQYEADLAATRPDWAIDET
jgi:hypothetical protein